MKKYEFLTNRIEAISRIIEENKLDYLFLTSRHASQYFADFGGSSSYIIAGKNKLIFITDGRYSAEAKLVDNRYSKLIYRGPLVELFKKEKMFSKPVIGIEGYDIPYAFVEEMKEVFKKNMFVDVGFDISRQVSRHDAESLSRMKSAVAATTAAYNKVLPMIKDGVTELDLASEISWFIREQGGDNDAFEPIVAFGKNTALPHAKPTTKKLKLPEIILFDMGCRYQGVHSDFTRTFVAGIKGKKAWHHAIGAVNEVLFTVEKMIAPGITGAQLDKEARRIFKKYSYEKYFTHAIGHGLGYKLHQFPRLSAQSKDFLETNQVVTIEPGIYLPDKFGARLENDYLITDNGAINLTNVNIYENI